MRVPSRVGVSNAGDNTLGILVAAIINTGGASEDLSDKLEIQSRRAVVNRE